MSMKYSKEQKCILVVSLLSSFITTFMGSALNLSIPDIEKDFQVSAAQVGWVITIYMLTCAALAVPFGKLADILSMKKIIRIGLFIFTAASAMVFISKNLWMLIAIRFSQAVGASMIFSTNIAVLTDSFEEKERGKILGYSTSATYVGMAAGPVIGGVLNYNFGWKSIFVAAAAVSAAAFFLTMKYLKREIPIKESSKKIDKKGTILFLCSMVLLMYGLSEIAGGIRGIGTFIAGAVLAAMFVIYELKREEPLLDIELFRENVGFTLANVTAMINYGSTFVVSYLLSVYLQVVKDYSSQKAGFILIAMPVVLSLLSPIIGKKSDKVSPCILAASGMFFCALAIGLLSFIKPETDIKIIFFYLALTGFGQALFAAPNANIIMASFAKERHGVVSSIYATARSVGHTAAMAVVTLIVVIKLGEQTLTQADDGTVIEVIHTCFFVLSGLCICGIFMALKRKV